MFSRGCDALKAGSSLASTSPRAGWRSPCCRMRRREGKRRRARSWRAGSVVGSRTPSRFPPPPRGAPRAGCAQGAGADGELENGPRPRQLSLPQLTWRARRDYKPGATAAAPSGILPARSKLPLKEGGARGPGRFVAGGARVAKADLAIWSQRREADLSTEQARSQAPARLPQPLGDGRRPQSPQRASRARPQASLRLILLEAAAGGRLRAPLR